MGTLIYIASKADVPTERVLMVDVDGKKIALCHRGNRIYAVSGNCTHKDRPLTKGSHGLLVNGRLQCVTHFAEFDPETGTCIRPPNGCMSAASLKTFPLVEVGDDLFIDLAEDEIVQSRQAS